MPKFCQPVKLATCIGVALGVGNVTQRVHAAPAAAKGAPAEIQFDLGQLANRGYSADVAKFFAREARFLPGMQAVNLSLNGTRNVRRELRFDSEGQPCFDRGLLVQLGLRVPDGIDGERCGAIDSLFPGARTELRPGIAAVAVTVPQDAFDPALRESAYQHGGRAALLNYNVFGQKLQSNFSNRNYIQAQLEPGLNIDNWAIRSQGSYTHAQGRSQYNQQSAYAQRSIEPIRSLLQVGEINSQSDAFGGIPVHGAQLFSDSAQSGTGRLSVPVQGIAHSNAMIELRQRGQVVYRTVVSPGPFSLSDVGAVVGGADIEVLVTEEDGRTSRFTVPAPMSNGQAAAPATYHAGVGRYRSDNFDAVTMHKPWMIYGDYAFNLTPHIRLTNAALFTPQYKSLSAQANLATAGNAWFGAAVRTSHAPQRGIGYEWQVQGNASFGRNFSGGLSWQSRSHRFSNLEDTILRYDDGAVPPSFQQSLSASLSWSNMKWGAFSYSTSRSRDWSGSQTFHSVSASRKIGRANVNLNLQKSSTHRKAAYLSVNLPLGKDSLSARVYHYGDSKRSAYSANYQGRLSADAGYNIDASTSGDDSRLGVTGNARTAYAQLSAGISQTNRGSRSMYGSLNGGLALTGDRTFAMSSSKIGDTFAIVKVPELSGLRLGTSGSSGRTTAWGTALMPAIYPYQNARIQVDGKSLPLNYRLDTTTIDMNLARGTVATHRVGATQIRQLMLQVRLADGALARVGTSITNGNGDFMGTVIGDGNVVLTNDDIGQPVYLETSGGMRCSVNYTTPAQFSADRPYEEAPATCA